MTLSNSPRLIYHPPNVIEVSLPSTGSPTAFGCVGGRPAARHIAELDPIDGRMIDFPSLCSSLMEEGRRFVIIICSSDRNGKTEDVARQEGRQRTDRKRKTADRRLQAHGRPHLLLSPFPPSLSVSVRAPKAQSPSDRRKICSPHSFMTLLVYSGFE